MLVWTCTEGEQGTYSDFGRATPTCGDGGAWVDIYGVGAAASELDPAAVAAAFGAGFTFLAVGMVIALAGRLIVATLLRL